MILTFLASATGASIAYEQVSSGNRNLVRMLMFTALFWSMATISFVRIFGDSNVVILLSTPAVFIFGFLGRCVVKLLFVYYGWVSPDEV